MPGILTGKKFWEFVGFLLISFVAGHMNAQTPSIATGIEGVILVGPTHGGPTHVGESDSAPLANYSFAVTGAAGEVTVFTTDTSGHFRIPLAPGRYSIKAGDLKIKFPRCGPFDVEVTADGFKKVHWECDSGMR
jgi:hypothetical protein